ncbi:MAG TPA: S9 family peptidase [Thermoanaerobaculia bacterium]|nr:S9 family peptidase [Thermoanaerobaculia bacterium]
MIRRLAALTLALFAALPLLAAPKRPITEKDIFRFHWIADPQLSPDGGQAAYVVTEVDEKGDRYTTSLWSVETRAGATPRRITNGPRDTMPRWSPDGRSLAFLRSAEPKDGKPAPAQIHLLSLSGGEPHAVTSLDTGVESIVWSPSGRTIAFTTSTTPDSGKKDDEKKKDERKSDVRVINQAVYRANGAGYADPKEHTHIWLIDVAEEAKPKQLTTGDFDENEPSWSPDGARLFFTSTRVAEAYYDENDAEDLYALPLAAGDSKMAGGEPVKLADATGGINRISVSPDGKWIAFVASNEKAVRSYDQPDLFVVSTAGGELRNLTASFDYDALGAVGGDQRSPRGGRQQRAVWSPDSKTLFFTAAQEGKVNLQRLDVGGGRIEPWTSGKQEIVNFAMTNGRTLALVSSPTRISDLFLVGNDGALTQLTDVNKKLWDELTLTEPEEIWYPSFDGKRVQAWVQRPPDFDATKKYPLILNIHGGPHAAYGFTFDHEFQWMAAKGYIVLYPNPRGSTSYGQEFGNIIQYRYPGDDYKDLMAGVDALIARGWADPGKLGITGGSGGGVLTNYAITQTDRFLAAVSQRSIADWSAWWYTGDFTLFQPTWFRKAPWQDPQDYVARSAITNVEKIHTPLMLIEGEADYRTPPAAGGEALFRALKYLHRPVVMVRFPGESHELSRSGKPWHRVERLEHIVGWFDRWVMGVPKPEYEAGLRK